MPCMSAKLRGHARWSSIFYHAPKRVHTEQEKHNDILRACFALNPQEKNKVSHYSSHLLWNPNMEVMIECFFCWLIHEQFSKWKLEDHFRDVLFFFQVPVLSRNELSEKKSISFIRFDLLRICGKTQQK